MSDNEFDTDGVSVSKERTAAEASVNAHGSDEWAEWKLNVNKLCVAADVEETKASMHGDSSLSGLWYQIYMLAKELSVCMERMESHNASTCEGRIPNA